MKAMRMCCGDRFIVGLFGRYETHFGAIGIRRNSIQPTAVTKLRHVGPFSHLLNQDAMRWERRYIGRPTRMAESSDRLPLTTMSSAIGPALATVVNTNKVRCRDEDFETQSCARSGHQNWRLNAKSPPSEDGGLSCNPTVGEFCYRQNKLCGRDVKQRPESFEGTVPSEMRLRLRKPGHINSSHPKLAAC